MERDRIIKLNIKRWKKDNRDTLYMQWAELKVNDLIIIILNMLKKVRNDLKIK